MRADRAFLEKYIPELQEQMHRNLGSRLQIPFLEKAVPHIFLPLISNAGLQYNDKRECVQLNINDCSLPTPGGVLLEEELALLELIVYHETGHVLHGLANPSFLKRYMDARKVFKETGRGRKIFNKLNRFGETVAKYLAWTHIQFHHDVPTFIKRLGRWKPKPSEEESFRAYTLCVSLPEEARLRLASQILSADYEQAWKLPNTRTLF